MAVMGDGFRGSTFSVMLTLNPDALGNYTKASFLTAGGIQSTIVNPSPGSYVATELSRVDTMRPRRGRRRLFVARPPVRSPRRAGTAPARCCRTGRCSRPRAPTATR